MRFAMRALWESPAIFAPMPTHLGRPSRLPCGCAIAARKSWPITKRIHFEISLSAVPRNHQPSPTAPQKFDAFVALDTSVKNRLGTVLEAIAPGTPILNIDHHISNESFGDVNYIDPSAPATGQILLEFFQRVGARISPEMATNLFAAISTDTGSFQYAGTNERTFAAASYLISCGVDVPGLSRAIYDNQPRRRFELLRHALNSAEFHCADRIATFSSRWIWLKNSKSFRRTTKALLITCALSRA